MSTIMHPPPRWYHGHAARLGLGEALMPVEQAAMGPIGPNCAQPVADPLVADSSAGQLPIWLYPPITWENVDQATYATLPAIGSTVTILSFTVPAGRNGVINKIANNFVGGGWIEGTGDLIWRILVDGAPPPGATSYNNIVNSLGNPSNPVAIPGFRFFENQKITVVAFNNPAGPNGGVVVAAQLVGARLIGYTYPRELEQSGLWT